MELAPVIAVLYQQSLDEGEVLAISCPPIFQRGSKSNPANYRLVALTAILCKQLEHFISSCLHSHLDKHNWINYQHGRCRMLSCVTQLYLQQSPTSSEPLKVEPERDSRLYSKAFDKVDRECLLRKLQSVGIEGKLLRWMHHYLTGRTQPVCIDGTTSEYCEVTSGPRPTKIVQ